ncbi:MULTISPECIES: ABC transporter ATP-binding protein [unclassified Microbacterium]|uniref:ABC transporter ATP-binding protein n=1 Tax=unclassified Microbacterium TaxID=2609290 RepID=UPI0016054523|nr:MULTISPECIES: ABC transporter ATP-binding protein [unclassified Microbacterium]QNA92065.1 ABC transporter ATP-binding protein [Microbacterium sp. Se63.02b]QYM65299.1 ABC transporter ATP-binding protein [Microbacterium sp. Se5.02b]
MTGIVVQDVSRAFGTVQAVRGATLRAEPGRVTGLVGPNGAGKTTLLLMLASLLAPDTGTIRIGDVDPAVDPLAARRLLGWMPDALGAWPSLTARETIVTTARLYGIEKADAAARAQQLLALVGLGDLADSPAKVLSRGQKQKLGLARALVHDPRVLLLDEPASGLDPEARVQLRVLLRRFAAEGRTVLISSHILSELEEVVDDAVFLVAGAVVDAAPAQTAVRAWRIRLAGVTPERLKADVWQVASNLGLAPESLASDRGAVLVGFDGEEAAAQSLRRLVEAGLPVAEFAPAQSDLEHTFLALRHTSTPAATPAPPPAPPAAPTEQSATEAGA